MTKIFFSTFLTFFTICFTGVINIETDSGTISYNLEDIQKITFENNYELIFVQGGSFEMGDHFNEGYSRELPVHSVNISDFYIGKYEVTQAEWISIMVNNPSHYLADNNPVENITWYDALEYCNALSITENLTPCYSGTGTNISCNFTANGYRLPTEAEWEYAARGGVNFNENLRYSGCHEESILIDYAWFDTNNTPMGSKEVGMKLPNQLNIFDMSGNVFEWCWDWSSENYYSVSPSSDPYGPSQGNMRVKRSGSFCCFSSAMRVANRDGFQPEQSDGDIGFRVVRRIE